MIFKNLDGQVPDIGNSAEDRAIMDVVSCAVFSDIPKAFEELAPSVAIDAWIKAVFACNQYVDAMAPWALRKTDPERMKQVLGTLFVCIRDLAIAIMPVIPASAQTLLEAMKVSADKWTFAFLHSNDKNETPTIGAPTPLFPRLELLADEGAALA
jgi:methionyl-tRNA synthetase